MMEKKQRVFAVFLTSIPFLSFVLVLLIFALIVGSEVMKRHDAKLYDEAFSEGQKAAELEYSEKKYDEAYGEGYKAGFSKGEETRCTTVEIEGEDVRVSDLELAYGEGYSDGFAEGTEEVDFDEISNCAWDLYRYFHPDYDGEVTWEDAVGSSDYLVELLPE